MAVGNPSSSTLTGECDAGSISFRLSNDPIGVEMNAEVEREMIRVDRDRRWWWGRCPCRERLVCLYMCIGRYLQPRKAYLVCCEVEIFVV
jgi:hypothetical protein